MHDKGWAYRERRAMLSRLLQDHDHEVTEKLRALRESLPDDFADVKTPEDQGVHEFVCELEFALMEMSSRTRGRIADALERLREGRYGVCSDCAGPIAGARLRALPFAERCRRCQEETEGVAAGAAIRSTGFRLDRGTSAFDDAAGHASAPHEMRGAWALLSRAS